MTERQLPPPESTRPGAHVRDGAHVVNDLPFTLRRRMHWRDADAAQIGYTGAFIDFGMEAAEFWWEDTIGTSWYGLRRHRRGQPVVALSFEFNAPIRPGDRMDLAVYLEQLGTSSISYRVEGTRVGGPLSFTGRFTSVLLDIDAGRPAPFPEAWRRRIEGYDREVSLRCKGLKSRREVLDYWYAGDEAACRRRWFGADGVDRAATDTEIREGFLATYELTMAGELDHWCESALGARALCIVLDQFPRNMFRGTPRMYEADEKARATAALALERGFDSGLPREQAIFLYMPFVHSEALADQERAVELFAGFAGQDGSEEALRSAARHHEIVARFGRFPHRNAILGRDSTAEEIAFLEEPGSSF